MKVGDLPFSVGNTAVKGVFACKNFSEIITTILNRLLGVFADYFRFFCRFELFSRVGCFVPSFDNRCGFFYGVAFDICLRFGKFQRRLRHFICDSFVVNKPIAFFFDFLFLRSKCLDFFTQLGKLSFCRVEFVVAHNWYGIDVSPYLFVTVLLLTKIFKNLFPDFSENARIGDFFKNIRFIIIIAGEETGKFALGEHSCSTELVEV